MIILKESVKSKFERKAKMNEEVISLKYSWNYHNNKKYLALVVRDQKVKGKCIFSYTRCITCKRILTIKPKLKIYKATMRSVDLVRLTAIV